MTSRDSLPPNWASWLSWVTLLGAALASATTLLWSGSFPPPPGSSGPNLALAEARGWSVVTLLVVVPLGTATLRAARRGSARGYLAWM